MQAITCPVILTSASTRADGSIGLRFATPELESSDKTAFFELLNKNLKMLLQPADEPPSGLQEVKSELETKTKSQRLRAVLFVEFQNLKPEGLNFEDYYHREMERIIEFRKQNLPQP